MSDQCLEQLRQRNLRVTPLRRALLALLHASPDPLSAPEIKRRLERVNQGVNKTSVYRTLELLECLGLLRKTVVNERTQYYELSERGHHHHLVCTRCDRMLDIPLPERGIIEMAEQQGRKIGFHIASHTLEFYGRCAACATGTKTA